MKMRSPRVPGNGERLAASLWQYYVFLILKVIAFLQIAETINYVSFIWYQEDVHFFSFQREIYIFYIIYFVKGRHLLNLNSTVFMVSYLCEGLAKGPKYNSVHFPTSHGFCSCTCACQELLQLNWLVGDHCRESSICFIFIFICLAIQFHFIFNSFKFIFLE